METFTHRVDEVNPAVLDGEAEGFAKVHLEPNNLGRNSLAPGFLPVFHLPVLHASTARACEARDYIRVRFSENPRSQSARHVAGEPSSASLWRTTPPRTERSPEISSSSISDHLRRRS